MSIIHILNNQSIDVDQKSAMMTKYLHALPNNGVNESIDFLMDTDNPTHATYLMNYLSIIPYFSKEKQEIVEYILKEKIDLVIAVVNLVKHMPEETIKLIIDKYLKFPDLPGVIDAFFEVAVYFPHVTRDFESNITDEFVFEALLPGRSDRLVDDLFYEYKKTKHPLFIRYLSRVRTDKSRDLLLKLQNDTNNKKTLYPYIENSGLFSENMKSCVYDQSYMGFVVSREEGSHYLGDITSVKCSKCDKEASHIITLNMDELKFDTVSGINPSFFLFDCDCNETYNFVHINDINNMDSKTTRKTTDFVPISSALLLVKHPNQFGRGMDAIPGFANHQVGGYPPWIDIKPFPKCPNCHNGMKFLVSIDSGMTPFGEMNFDGIIYGFWCDICAISTTYLQS